MIRARPTMTDEEIQAILQGQVKPAEEEKEEEKAIFCKSCGCKITAYDQVTIINGQSQHTFNNPAGIVYTIGCFMTAEGCINQGSPTPEHTWFPGFSWSFAHCSRCYRHLGWFYRADSKSFYGLILDNLM
jgi:hypothetical protein